jgi:DMSO/TMAO reductase YedYZ molybdopterin-dependent catalytic subunit
MAQAKDRLIVRSARPQDLETPVELFNSWLTPNDLFYVRSHLHTPEVNLKDWSLTVEGQVGRPLKLTLEELKLLPKASVVVTLECAGNGRAFFDPAVAGVQWQKGSVGTARWSGARLADVLKKAGVNPAGHYVLLDGADRAFAGIPDFMRNVPIAKAMHPDTVLAYEMNDAPLPVPHGSPLRAVIPGWEGAYSVKWLNQIRVIEGEHDGFWVKTAYRYPTRRLAPGEAVEPKDMAPLTGLAVKSLISSPMEGARLGPGEVRIQGFAWAGEANITRVDISTDNGSTWTPARLGKDRARYAWRQFEFSWRPAEAGSYLIMSRAADDQGRVQPIAANWNPSGYLWNVIDQVRVQVGARTENVAPAAVSRRPILATDDPGNAIFKNKCLTCHEADMTEQQRLSRAGWVREVDKMIRWGTNVSPAEKDSLVEFLFKNFGPRPR